MGKATQRITCRWDIMTDINSSNLIQEAGVDHVNVENIFWIISDYIRLISRHRVSNKMEIFKSKFIMLLPQLFPFNHL